MIIVLRCERHKHGEYDPETGIYTLKCSQCSKAAGEPVYHRYRIQNGVMVGADGHSHTDPSQ